MRLPPPTRSGIRAGLGVRAAAVFLICAAAGYALAPGDGEPTSSMLAVPTPSASGGPGASTNSLNEEVQELLAKGGCPGWIALASEPNLLRADGNAAPHEFDRSLRQTSAETEAPPQVAYPVPVRPPQGEETLRLVSLPPVADDELISESEDLLLSSPEVAGPASSKEAAPPAAEPATSPPQPNPEQPSPPREYTPQELLREQPLSSTPAPAAIPSVAPSADELIDAKDDLLGPAVVTPPPAAPRSELLEDQGDLLSPPLTSPQSPANRAVPAPAAPISPPANVLPAPAAPAPGLLRAPFGSEPQGRRQPSGRPSLLDLFANRLR